MLLKTSLFHKICSYSKEIIIFIKFSFFSLCFLISFCIKAGQEQQIGNDFFFEGMDPFAEPGRWVFKKIDQELIPANIGNSEVLLIIEEDFLINNEPDSELGLDLTLGLDINPEQNIYKERDSYMILSAIQMLAKKEVKKKFIDFDDSYVFTIQDLYLLNKIEEHSFPLLEVEAHDIYVDGAFEKNILKYNAVVLFTFDVSNEAICKVRYNHQENNQNKKKLYLNTSDDTSDYIFSAINHINANLTKEKSDSEETTKLYTSTEYTHSHVKDVSENTRSAVSIRPNRKTYECKVCGKVGLYNIWIHMFSHTKKSYFNCLKCNKSFSCKYDLRIHFQSHITVGYVVCVKCNKRFNYKKPLDKHGKKYADDNDIYSCRTCDSTFNSRHFLRKHKLIHGTRNTYICKGCSEILMDYSTLQVNKMVHAKKKPYSCNMCNKTFTLDHNAKRHMRTHTKKDYIACSACDKKFTAKSSLKTHMRTIHKAATDSCIPDS
ncbi:MAG: C2H2-type zinc finger protein [Candidatus Endonucleobacter bathymodioli]|uniref:C2H2-type zinc finger protein n=1 Tax=Candidatus Endonucleibacter bathymodioli TaxID=539814 RepID=A0AA90NYU6_9GAMM|nr:C2H2-type zinc finger protein [Candidatus Endonucleobacter bathymodioli]